MKLISAQECQKRLKSESLHLVDVREDWEYAICSIAAEHIPMHRIAEAFSGRDKNAAYVIVCKAGNRAQAVANLLETEGGFTNLFVLEGGIVAWLTLADPTFEAY